MPFVRMKGKADHEFRLTHMLLHVRRSNVDGDSSPDLILYTSSFAVLIIAPIDVVASTK